ncbi:MAG TPA: hypothetical protein VGR40_06205 [Candidatus Binatus sp.]|nr:hypothetical protein [Candidatus Binatus sp.]
MTKAIAFSLVFLSLSGCTVHRELAPQSVPSSIALGSEKLPLTVAVIGDPNLTFDYPRYFKAFVEVLNPGLAQTLQSAFRGNFQDVNVVEAQQAANGADLLASPTLSLTDPMKLTVTFVEPRSRRIIAEFSSERSCDGNAPGVYSHLATDLLLFAAVVVFPPADVVVTHQIDEHNADRFNAAFAPAIARMAGDIAYKASRDPQLRAFGSARAQSSSGANANTL